MSKRLMNGFESVAYAALEEGANFFVAAATSPAVEIIKEPLRQKSKINLDDLNTLTTVDCRTAFDAAISAAIQGSHAVWACSHAELFECSTDLLALRTMKIRGAIVIITSSDTNTPLARSAFDIRSFAQFAKIPLFDPADTKQAMQMAKTAVTLSNEYEIPVLLSLSTLVVGTSMFYDLDASTIGHVHVHPAFDDVYLKSVSLDEKIAKIAHAYSYDQRLIPLNRIYDRSVNKKPTGQPDNDQPVKLGIACAGSNVPFLAEALKIITEVAVANNTPIPPYRVLQVCTPYPYPKRAVYRFMTGLSHILVIEGPDEIIENGMIKDNANLILTPKIKGIPAIGDISQIEQLTHSIASFFDAALKALYTFSYELKSLRDLIGAYFQNAEQFQTSVKLVRRNPSRYDEIAFTRAYYSFINALDELKIAPDMTITVGMPQNAGFDRMSIAISKELVKTPPRIEASSFHVRLSWLVSALERSPESTGVIFASIDEVSEGFYSLLSIAEANLDVTAIIVNSSEGESSSRIDAVMLFQALTGDMFVCNHPDSAQAAEETCRNALAVEGFSVAILVGEESVKAPNAESQSSDSSDGAVLEADNAVASERGDNGSNDSISESSKAGAQRLSKLASQEDVQESSARASAKSDQTKASKGTKKKPSRKDRKKAAKRKSLRDVNEAARDETEVPSVRSARKKSDAQIRRARQERSISEELAASDSSDIYVDEIAGSIDVDESGANAVDPKAATADSLTKYTYDLPGTDLTVTVSDLIQSFNVGEIELPVDMPTPSEPFLTLRTFDDDEKLPKFVFDDKKDIGLEAREASDEEILEKEVSAQGEVRAAEVVETGKVEASEIAEVAEDAEIAKNVEAYDLAADTEVVEVVEVREDADEVEDAEDAEDIDDSEDIDEVKGIDVGNIVDIAGFTGFSQTSTFEVNEIARKGASE